MNDFIVSISEPKPDEKVMNEKKVPQDDKVNPHLMKPPLERLKFQCRLCNGTGEVPNSVQSVTLVEKEVKCVKCNGEGWKIKTCKICNGSKKVQGEKCPRCDGKGVWIMRKTLKLSGQKCNTCRGTGKIKEFEEKVTIVSTIKCRSCDGTGKTDKFQNPVIVCKDILFKLNLK